MTNTSLPAGRFAQGDFRVGHVLSQSWQVSSRNFLRFTLIAAVVLLPSLLAQQPTPANPLPNPGALGIVSVVVIVLYLLSQATLLHAAFQDMSGRPVKLTESLLVGLRRFFPIIGVGLVEVIALGVYVVALVLAAAGLGQLLQSGGLVALFSIIGIFPAFMLYLMWSVAIPACVVERLGPLRSLGRSRQLTKGHRWKIFGMLLLILIALLIGSIVIGALVGVGAVFALSVGSDPFGVAGRVVGLIINAIVTAFFTILVAVTYHDLRVAKEGIDTEQIAAVFD
jgi:hypothetical protein